MSQLLQPLSIFDFTPSSSPTKLSGTMSWLKHTPTSVPLPPSPTKPRECSDDDNPTLSPESQTLTQSNFTKVMRSLQKKSSSFALQSNASCSSLAATPISTPQREALVWFSRPSPIRAATSAPPANELGDHFARSPPTYEEKQAGLRRRREASQKRVQGMRAYLETIESINGDVYKVREEPQKTLYGPVRVHQRYDSGSHEYADSDALQELQKLHDTNKPENMADDPPTLPPLDRDFIFLSLFRLRSRPPLRFDCVGCKKTHRDSLLTRAAVTWLLQGCGHYVDSGCFGKLRDPEESDYTDDCFHCAHLKLMLKNLSQDEVDLRHERLLDATSGDVGSMLRLKDHVQ